MNSRVQDPEAGVVEQAAEWYWEIREPDVADSVIVDWQSWLAASADNRAAYERIEQSLDAVSLVDTPPWPTETELLRDRYDGSSSVAHWLESDGDRRVSAPQPEARLPRSRTRRFALAIAATVAAVAVSLVAINGGIGSTPAAVETVRYQTSAAEHRDVMLPDGSSVSLGASTDISVTYDSTSRRIDFSAGEAFFDVAADVERPFEVAASGRRLVAVGTAFNVSRQAGRVTLTVTEGTVVVERQPGDSDSGNSSRGFARVEAGQRIRFDGDRVRPVASADPVDALAWRNGVLKYRGETLRYVIEDVNRYTRVPVRIADEQAAGLEITGTVFQDSAESWVYGLESGFPVRVERSAQGISIHHAGPQ